jgi:hypothetical protein
MMALAPLTLYILISGTIMLLIAIVFDAIILRQFIRKRTMGTILLFMSYLFFTLGEASTIMGDYIFTFQFTTENTGGLTQLLYAPFYGIAFIFFYFFANRHILQDSDLVKSSIATFIAFLIGLAYAYSTADVIFFDSANPIFYNKALLAGIPVPGGGFMPQFLLSTFIGLGIYLPVLFLIQLRVVVKIFRIRRGLEKRISRAGFTYIFLSVLFLVLGTISSSFFLFDFVQNTPFLNILSHTLRIVFNILGFLFAYFGWVLPDWLKRRIRGKAWITKQISTRGQKIDIQPIASSKSDSNSVKIVEVNEP